jgi:hypothetical protein
MEQISIKESTQKLLDAYEKFKHGTHGKHLFMLANYLLDVGHMTKYEYNFLFSLYHDIWWLEKNITINLGQRLHNIQK